MDAWICAHACMCAAAMLPAPWACAVVHLPLARPWQIQVRGMSSHQSAWGPAGQVCVNACRKAERSPDVVGPSCCKCIRDVRDARRIICGQPPCLKLLADLIQPLDVRRGVDEAQLIGGGDSCRLNVAQVGLQLQAALKAVYARLDSCRAFWMTRFRVPRCRVRRNHHRHGRSATSQGQACTTTVHSCAIIVVVTRRYR